VTPEEYAAIQRDRIFRTRRVDRVDRRRSAALVNAQNELAFRKRYVRDKRRRSRGRRGRCRLAPRDHGIARVNTPKDACADQRVREVGAQRDPAHLASTFWNSFLSSDPLRSSPRR
jgi:hypothetical protein